MTGPDDPESGPERILSALMRGAFIAAFACLAAGLAFWLIRPDGGPGDRLLTVGLIGLLTLPALRLASAIAAAAHDRDWILLYAALGVAAILVLLTVRDAAGW